MVDAHRCWEIAISHVMQPALGDVGNLGRALLIITSLAPCPAFDTGRYRWTWVATRRRALPCATCPLLRVGVAAPPVIAHAQISIRQFTVNVSMLLLPALVTIQVLCAPIVVLKEML